MQETTTIGPAEIKRFAHAADPDYDGPISSQQDPEGGEAQQPAPPITDLRLDGTTQLGLFDAGGKRPTSASVRLSGGKVSLVDGRAFKKGETLRLEVECVVTAVKQQDTRDKETGIAVSCEQQHIAHITDVRIVE